HASSASAPAARCAASAGRTRPRRARGIEATLMSPPVLRAYEARATLASERGHPREKMPRRTLWIGSAALALAVVGSLALPHGRPREEPPADLDQRVRAECSRCHAFAPPDVLPREAWRKQIEHMAFLSEYVPSSSAPTD